MQMRLPRVAFARFFFAPAKCLSSVPGWFFAPARAQEFRTRVVFCSCEGAELGTRVVFNICEPAGAPHQGGFLLLRALFERVCGGGKRLRHSIGIEKSVYFWCSVHPHRVTGSVINQN